MFCPFCRRQIKDSSVFCPYCHKALPQKGSSPVTQTIEQIKTTPQSTRAPKKGVSMNVQKAIVTGIAIIVLTLLVIQFYYPGVLPWNW